MRTRYVGMMVSLAALAASTGLAPVWAADDSTAATADVPPADAPAPAPAPAAPAAQAPSQAKSAADALRMQLDGTHWTLQLTAMASGSQGKVQNDTLTFSARTISSERLAKSGYPDSNYSLTVGDDGTAVWETMQTKEGKGVVFWRGELHGASMQGVLSQQPVEGASEDFAFTATERDGKTAVAGGAVMPTAAVSQAAAVQPKPQAAAAPASRKKKKKGWLW